MFNNPYGGYGAGINAYPPYQQPMQYPQQYNQFQQPQVTQPQSPMIRGQIVDSIDAVRAKDVDLSGNPVWYPRADKGEVYCKQLNPNTGETDIYTYKLVPKQDPVQLQPANNGIADVLKEIEELKMLMLEHITAPSGGANE